MFYGNRNNKGGFRLWPILTHCFPRYYNLFRDMNFKNPLIVILGDIQFLVES
jgi:hypothetical protein